MSRKALIMQQTDNCCHIVGRSALKARQQESGEERERAIASTACTQIKLQIFTWCPINGIILRYAPDFCFVRWSISWHAIESLRSSSPSLSLPLFLSLSFSLSLCLAARVQVNQCAGWQGSSNDAFASRILSLSGSASNRKPSALLYPHASTLTSATPPCPHAHNRTETTAECASALNRIPLR